MSQERSPVIYFSRSWRSLIPQFSLAIIISAIGIWATLQTNRLYLPVELPIGENGIRIYLPFFLLISLVLFVRPFVQLIDSHFEISHHHLRIIRGKFSIHRRTQEFAYEDLLGVQVTQSIIERVLGVGMVQVGSKTHHINLFMRGVARPQYFADLISRRIDASRINERNDGRVHSKGD